MVIADQNAGSLLPLFIPCSTFEKMLAVVLEFFNRLLNVGKRFMLAVLGETRHDFRLPALGEFL
jgi:hypothetical protein